MPVAATQTEPMWDVIDKLNTEFDELQVKNNKIEEELMGFHLEKHKKNNETVMQLQRLFRMCDETDCAHWEIQYEYITTDFMTGFNDFAPEYPVLNYLREYIYGDEEAELDDDIDEYFGRGRHAPHTQQAESRIDELLRQRAATAEARAAAQWEAWINRRRV